MDIRGKAKVWANEFDGPHGKYKRYSLSISSKNQDGTWTNANLPVRFKKGVDVENGAFIEVTSGFLTAESYTNREGQEVKNVVAVVTEFVTH